MKLLKMHYMWANNQGRTPTPHLSCSYLIAKSHISVFGHLLKIGRGTDSSITEIRHDCSCIVGLRIVDVSTAENDEQRQKSPSQADLAHIEYDPQVVGSMMDDNSSISSGSLRDSTASITSSILEYRHINGRPFQQSKKTEYWSVKLIP
ncbi:Sodium transport ATPase 2 [Fusarium oxysporum f. sp. albedinis]|nr:Sodium transport ATPase 2 [Fusarium oxysporum f. sp. albedinis]